MPINITHPSFELLTDSIDSIQKKYEILSDIVTKYNGRIPGSQLHVNENMISLVLYIMKFQKVTGKK